MNPEALERRCPRLGGDVVAHLQACLSPEVFKTLSKPCTPPNKVTSLVDLIRQAQERAAQD